MLPLFPPSAVQNESSPQPVQVYWTTFILRTAEGGKSDQNVSNRQARSSAPGFVFVRHYVMACDFYCHNRRIWTFTWAARCRRYRSSFGRGRRVYLSGHVGSSGCGLRAPSI